MSRGVPTDLLRLARALHRAHRLTPRLTPKGAPMALRARAQALRLGARLLRISGAATELNRPLADLDARRNLADPAVMSTVMDHAGLTTLAALALDEARAIGRQNESVIDLLRQPPRTDYERNWREVLAAATAAAAALDELGQPPPRHLHVTLNLDAAAVVAAIATLDQRLLPAVDEALGTSTRVTSGRLRATAALVRESAHERGPALPLESARWATGRAPEPIAVATPGGLVHVQSLLPALLRNTKGITPGHIQAIVRAQRLGLQLADGVLSTTDDAPLLERAATAVEPLRAVKGDPQVLNLASVAPVGERALTAQLDSYLEFLHRALVTVRKHPDRARQYAPAARRFLELTPAVVLESYRVVVTELRTARWLSTLGQGEALAQRHTWSAQPRLLSALRYAAGACAIPATDRTLSLKQAAADCGVSDRSLRDRKAELAALGATVPDGPSQTWQIPVSALTAAGLRPTLDLDAGRALTIAAAARLCGVEPYVLRRRKAALIAAGAQAPAPDRGWQIPASALLALGLVPVSHVAPVELTGPPPDSSQPQRQARREALSLHAHLVLDELTQNRPAYAAILDTPAQTAAVSAAPDSLTQHQLLETTVMPSGVSLG